MSKDARVLLGRIAGVHGLKGEVVVHAYTEYPEDIAAYGPLTDTEGLREFELEIVRISEKGVIARISGVRDRTHAEPLKGLELWVPRERLPEAEEGEFYHADLVGLAAVTPNGEPIGTVVAVQNYGASDLLEIRLEGSRRTEFVAFTDAFVPEVDIAGRRVVVHMNGDPPSNSDDVVDAQTDSGEGS